MTPEELCTRLVMSAHDDCRHDPCPYCKALIEKDTGLEPDRDEAGTDPANRMEER